MICQTSLLEAPVRSESHFKRQIESRQREIRRQWTHDERIRRQFEAHRRQQQLWELIRVSPALS